MRTIIATGVVLASCLAAGSAFAQIAVSSNDGKMALENGVAKTVANPPPDSVTVLDLGVSQVKVLGTISGVPGSVAGPPLSVAITPDESLALVAASSKIDPNDPAKTIADDRVTIVDLKSQKVLGQVQAGPGAAGTSITRDGKRAYVANRAAGSVSILSIDGNKVSVIKTVQLMPAEALLSHIALAPDGRTGVITRNGEGKVDIVKLSGDEIKPAATITVAPRPYAAVVHPGGKTAVVASLGDPKGGNGVLTVIDLASNPVGTIVGQADIGAESLEGMMMSADGKWIAGVAHNGSTRPKNAPQYKPAGMLVLYSFDGHKLTKMSEAPIGTWSQGAAFSRDGKTVAVQNMVEKNIQVFHNDNGKLTDTGQKIAVPGGPAAIRTADK
jgi:DNA-binding beta-propeller fold protein YncE